MAQKYDKIFKENIEELILPLAKKVLDLNLDNLEEIKDDLQTTLERKPDFLKKVISKNKNEKEYILHIEFQTVDEPKMVYRMLEYYGILTRKYELEIRQYVFYIGKGKAMMVYKLNHQNIDFKFELINIQDFYYQDFLNSDKPEEVILSILADFGKQNAQEVIEQVLQKLKYLPIDNLKYRKSVIQLDVLSNLRDFQRQFINQLLAMAFTYNMETDLRYQEGEKVGEKRGEKRGEKKGEEKANTKAILVLSKIGTSNEQIAQYLDVSIDFVETVLRENK